MTATSSSPPASEIPVLISGAGPVGILTAIMLTRLGIPVRIIERDRTVPQMSKALSIHARTLEILDMTGLIDRFLAAGHPISSSNFYILGDFLNFAGLINSISHYNYALFLEQLKTIAILEDELEQRGVKIDRGWELMDTKVVGEEDGSSYVETTIRRALDGSNTRATESKKVFGLTDLDAEEIDKQYEIQVVRSQYLIGADGGRSVVRHKVPIAFPGRTVPNNMILFDGHIETDLNYNNITVVYGKNNEMFNIFPLSNGCVRIMADGTSLDPNEELTIEKLEKVCQACAAPYKFRILDSNWLTFYKVNERRAETYSHKNRIFLAGDAAHVHSPVGGQDAYNLAWKLALVLNGHAGDELLQTYEQECIPVADDLSIRYHENFVNQKHTTQPLPAEAYKVGQRAHDAPLATLLAGGKLGDSIRLHQLLHGPGTFHIVVFTSDMLSTIDKKDRGIAYTDEKKLEHSIQSSLKKWRSKWAYGSELAKKAGLSVPEVPLFNIHVVAALPEKLAAGDFVDPTRIHADALAAKAVGEGKNFFDPTSLLHERYGIAVKGGSGAIVVLRPDSHIGYRVSGAGDDAWQDVDSYFGSILKS
ncbi:hypothetical protein BGZ74_008005 [Mortierella antarctica]|nr:hypothetical protein BGZ74_008005 [Mortierella antarctica]